MTRKSAIVTDHASRDRVVEQAIGAYGAALGRIDAPEDRERVEYRLRIALAGAYDLDNAHGTPQQAIIDLLTDVLHYCDMKDVDFDYSVDEASRMRDIEREDWGL